MFHEHALFKVVHDGVFPLGYGLSEELGERAEGGLGCHVGVSVACAYKYVGFYEYYGLAFKVEFYGCEFVSDACCEHRCVVYEERTVGSYLYGVFAHLQGR